MSSADPISSDGENGLPPRGDWRLPAALRLGPVHLQVSDLARSIDFYEQVLGMQALSRGGGGASLAAQGSDAPLVRLTEHAGAARWSPRGKLGLFHFAILLPDRASLGRFVQHASSLGVRLGAGDHLVSEAFYLSDPDALGIEVYADRPRERWQYRGRELLMATDPVDVDDLLRDARGEPWMGMPAETVMGHVHLHVGAIEVAREFYSDAFGFDVTTWSYPGALFMSAGGYHHHLGVNNWAGEGARAAAEGDARLLDWNVVLPTTDDLGALERSLAQRGLTAAREGAALRVRDPWGTSVVVSAEN